MSDNVTIKEAMAVNLQTYRITKALFMLKENTPADDDINYKSLYYGMFNGITTILEDTHTYEEAITALKQLQAKAEDAYVKQIDNYTSL